MIGRFNFALCTGATPPRPPKINKENWSTKRTMVSYLKINK
jgi:hypothetical protein